MQGKSVFAEPTRARRGGFRIVRAIVLALVVWLYPSTVSATDLWPLVKRAESAVWGTLTDIVDGVEDRVLMIDVLEAADGRETRGPARIRLLERAGRFPDGTPLWPGTTGL